MKEWSETKLDLITGVLRTVNLPNSHYYSTEDRIKCHTIRDDSMAYDTDDALDDLIPAISNWGKWGDDDELGTINYITSECVRQAAALVITGETVSLARESRMQPFAENQISRTEQYVMNNQGNHSFDFVGMIFHGFKFTHLDGLCHIFAEDKLYNGYSSDNVKTTGTLKLGIEKLAARGITGRGVLLDIARIRGRLNPGEVIRLSDLEEAMVSQKTEIRSGDILLIRSGTGERNTAEALSGMHPEIIPWLHDREISVLGNDGGSDYLPNPYVKHYLPLHSLCIPHMGLPLLDNAELDTLAEVCSQEDRWEFMLTIAPWRLVGVSGSPVNPIAVF
jgi:kynurenine formamidase